MKYTANEFLKVAHALEAKSYTAASTSGATVDVTGYDECLVILNVGVAAANAELDVALYEGPTLTACTGTISGASFRQVTATNDQLTYVGRIDLRKRDKYLQARFACDGSNAVIASCDFILVNPKYGPASQVNTVAFNI